MAEYKIQDTTLDAIADAINAKTGGSSAMTPAEMVTEIAAIPSGGTRTPVKLGEYTITEPVRTLQITLTQEMRELEKLWVFSTSPITKDQSDYLYFGFGSSTDGYFSSATSNSFTGMLFNVQSADLGDKHYNAQSFMFTNGAPTVARSTEGSIPTTIRFYCYSAAKKLTGGTIEIWG